VIEEVLVAVVMVEVAVVAVEAAVGVLIRIIKTIIKIEATEIGTWVEGEEVGILKWPTAYHPHDMVMMVPVLVMLRKKDSKGRRRVRLRIETD
jgi:hypothetical protein